MYTETTDRNKQLVNNSCSVRGQRQRDWVGQEQRHSERQTDGERETDLCYCCPAGEEDSGGSWRPGRDLLLASCWLCVCVRATVTENGWCTEARADSNEIFSRTKQMHLFSLLEEFANVHI